MLVPFTALAAVVLIHDVYIHRQPRHLPHQRHDCITGNRAFPIAAARTQNNKPSEVTSSQTLSSFKSQLKTYLFSLSFPGLWYSIILTVKWLQCFSTIHLKVYVCICKGKKGKGKADIDLPGNPISDLRDVTRNMGSQLYLPPDTSEHDPPNPSHAGWYSIYLHRRDGRLSWPSWLDSAPAGSWTSDLSIMSPTPNGCTTKTTICVVVV